MVDVGGFERLGTERAIELIAVKRRAGHLQSEFAVDKPDSLMTCASRPEAPLQRHPSRCGPTAHT
jgi:hypothetical protein